MKLLSSSWPSPTVLLAAATVVSFILVSICSFHSNSADIRRERERTKSERERKRHASNSKTLTIKID